VRYFRAIYTARGCAYRFAGFLLPDLLGHIGVLRRDVRLEPEREPVEPGRRPEEIPVMVRRPVNRYIGLSIAIIV